MGVMHSSLMFDFDLETGADVSKDKQRDESSSIGFEKGCLMKTAINQFVSWKQVQIAHLHEI